MTIGIDCRLIRQTGVGRYINNLIENLLEIDKKNNYVVFVRKEDFDQVKFKIKNLKLKIIPIDISWHSFREQTQFPKILESQKLDLVHFPYFSVPILYKGPYVITIHDLIIHHFPTGKASTLPGHLYILKVLVYKYVIKKAAQKARKVISVSNSTKEEAIDHLNISSDKIRVIYEGADTENRNHKSSPQMRDPDWKLPAGQTPNKIKNLKLKNKNYFLYVGNAYPHKNLESLIKAFSEFRKYFPKAELVLSGREDFFYKRLREYAKKMKTDENVKFLGFVSDEDLNLLYKKTVALVCPSFMEGFGLPALEAMTNKCLVLASNIPAFHEVLKDNALYFDPYSISDISEKMRTAYLGKFDKEILERGFKRSKEFSWRKMSEETLKIYEESIG